MLNWRGSTLCSLSLFIVQTLQPFSDRKLTPSLTLLRPIPIQSANPNPNRTLNLPSVTSPIHSLQTPSPNRSRLLLAQLFRFILSGPRPITSTHYLRAGLGPRIVHARPECCFGPKQYLIIFYNHDIFINLNFFFK